MPEIYYSFDQILSDSDDKSFKIANSSMIPAANDTNQKDYRITEADMTIGK